MNSLKLKELQEKCSELDTKRTLIDRLNAKENSNVAVNIYQFELNMGQEGVTVDQSELNNENEIEFKQNENKIITSKYTLLADLA